MFADDTKLYRHITTEDDREELQKDLDKLQKWSETWLLRFNASKCKCMHMGHSNDGLNYHLGGETIPHDSEEKDLWVIISADCKTSKQCVAAANKAMGKLRVIKRTFKYFNTNYFAVLYKTYICPHLEYCIQAWSPSLKAYSLISYRGRSQKFQNLNFLHLFVAFLQEGNFPKGI